MTSWATTCTNLSRPKKAAWGLLDNAIPLCVRCHTLFGQRKDTRDRLRQARHIGYEVVHAKYSTDLPAYDVDHPSSLLATDHPTGDSDLGGISG